MLALLYKDFLMLRKEKMVWVMFALAVLGGLAAGSQPSTSVFLIFFPVYWAVAYSNAYDYKYGAEAVLVSLPVSRRAIVGAKYLLGLAVSMAAIALAAAAGLSLSAFHALPGGFPPGFAILALALCAFFTAISLAAYFRFGYLKSRWVTIALFVAPSVLVGIISGSRAEDGAAKAGPALNALVSDYGNLAAILAVSLAALCLSFLYSARVFGRKEF